MTQRQLMRATIETPIGRMMMASDGEGLTELCLEDWWWATDHQAVLDSNRESDREPDVFRMTRVWLTAYFAGERPGLDQTPPLHPAGTPFQHEVWNLVAEIPYGMTVSYGELAAELAERRGGGRMAAQAVGGAVKRSEAQSGYHHRALSPRSRLGPRVWRLRRPTRHQGRVA